MSPLRADIRTLSTAGLTAPQIASRLGVACNTVRYHLARLDDDAGSRSDDRPAPTTAMTRVRTREQVARLLDDGLSRAEVARELGLAKSTVSYHARRLGAAVDERGARRYDWAAVQSYYDAGASVRECCAAFGFSKQSWHDAVRRGAVTPRPAAMPLSALFAAGTSRGREHLKRRMISAGLRRSQCERCGLTDWQGRPLALALHHVNGDRHDNRLENLQLLCPNCHSQTENFGGRNRTPVNGRTLTERRCAPTTSAADPGRGRSTRPGWLRSG